MEIKIKMSDVLAFKNGIDFFNNKQLPLPGAYKLTKISNALDKESEFYSKRIQEIIEKYAKRDDNNEYVFSEDGEQIIIQEDKIEEANEEMEELIDLEVTVDNMDLSIENLGNIDCSPEELQCLMPFIQ